MTEQEFAQRWGFNADEMAVIKPVMIMFKGEMVGVKERSGDDLARDGMAKAVKNADSVDLKWSEKAMSALCRFISLHKGPFQAEDVRRFAVSVPHPPSLRAWGSVIVKAARLGLIEAVGYETVSNPLAHSTPARVWRAS
jgi:hypothetical protein